MGVIPGRARPAGATPAGNLPQAVVSRRGLVHNDFSYVMGFFDTRAVWLVMVNLTQGKVISFDQVKGYGFVSPLGGGEDVFLHVNDLLDEKHLLKPGVIVEFITEQGDRGPKASSTHIVPAPPGGGHTAPARRSTAPVVEGGEAPDGGDPDNEYIDVLPAADFSREITEVLLLVEPGLTGPQIRAVRKRLTDLGSKYGWIGN